PNHSPGHNGDTPCATPPNTLKFNHYFVNPAALVSPYQGLDHFGLTVKDIDAVAAEIKAKGVEFTREPTTIRPGVRICFIRGPQGISVELLERDRKYA